MENIKTTRSASTMSPRPFFFLFLFALAISSTLPLFALEHPDASSDTSTVIIVGTVHNPTECYDIRVLGGIVEEVKPDLILVELDSSFFGPSMVLKPGFEGISLENRVVATHQQLHAVPVRPYDIEGRNRIYEQHNYFKLQRELSAALGEAEQANLLDNRSIVLLDAVTRFDRIGAGFGSARPEVINSSACDVAMESKQYYAGEGMVQIVSSVPSLASFVEFCKFKRDFWVQRNEAMVSNIVRWAQWMPGRTILVLCGYEHRYYLRSGLKSRAETGAMVVREYWDR